MHAILGQRELVRIAERAVQKLCLRFARRTFVPTRCECHDEDHRSHGGIIDHGSCERIS
jgi:hypothetical protein